MILFDLNCSNKHVFEAWFSSSSQYENQLQKGLINCPICGNSKISKQLMAPNINTKVSPSSEKQKVVSSKESDEIIKNIRKLKKIVENNTQDVGKDFAEEARKIYYGEKKYHPIRGETTPEEANDLEEEGVPFARMPWNSKEDA